ncbi:MAG: SCO family protein, partial [Pseudomonadota bacterium]
MRYGRISAVVVAIVAILAGEWIWLKAERERSADGGPSVTTTVAAAPGGPFSLIDHFGQPVTDMSYRGKYLVLVFGYTSCPDVCPTTLNTVAAAMAQLGDKAQSVQPLFVTVDPERDTPTVLARFVAAFHPRLVGLTGDPAQIRQVTRDYRVYVSKANTGNKDHPVDH